MPVETDGASPALYRARGWWRPERLDELVLRHAAGAGDRPAVVGAQALTHAGLASAVDAAAQGLTDLGLKAPRPVLVQLPNSVELLALTLALLRMGCPPILAHPALRRHELLPVVADLAPVAAAVPARSGAFDHPEMVRELRHHQSALATTLVLGGSEALGPGEVDLQEALGAAAPSAQRPTHRTQAGDTALYFLSSGTTGPPKPVPRTHEALGFVLRHASVVAGLGPESVYLAALPATHCFTCAYPGVLGTLASGGAVALAAEGDVELLLDLFESVRPTHCALVPALVEQLLEYAPLRPVPRDLKPVIQVGGARLDPVTAGRVRTELGWRLQQGYGMSEGLVCFTRLDDPDEVVVAVQGRPVAPGDELLVVGEDGRPVPAGEEGELWVRGPSVITAYAGRAERETGRFGPKGHYRTGDLVRMTPDGNVVVTGRLKDVINRAGEKIPADDVEALLVRHPLVRAVAVVGFPHQIYGEGTCAVVVPDPSADGQPLTLWRLRRYLTEQGLAPYKLPDRLLLAEELPRVGVGKVDKAAVRRLVEGRGCPPEPLPSAVSSD